MIYLIHYLCVAYTVRRMVYGSSFKASNQEIDDFINQLLASQRFDELADKIAEKAIIRLMDNDTRLIKNATTTAEKFNNQQLRFEEKRRDKDSKEFSSKEVAHRTFYMPKKENILSINSKAIKDNIPKENLMLNYNTLKKHAQEKTITTHHSEFNKNKPKWIKIENSYENDEKFSEYNKRGFGKEMKNDYENNRERFEREFNKNIDQREYSEEVKHGYISENNYDQNRDRFNIESHENIDHGKRSHEIEHDNKPDNYEKSNYQKSRDQFERGNIHKNVYKYMASEENKPDNSQSLNKNIYDNRNKFERGQGGLNITFSSENEDVQGYDLDQQNKNDEKVNFKSEPIENPTSVTKDKERLTLIDVENVPINRGYNNRDDPSFQINIDKEPERESYVEVTQKMETYERKDENVERSNNEEHIEALSHETTGPGKRIIRKEHGKFYTYVSRPEYEEFQEELEKQKEIEKTHRRIE